MRPKPANLVKYNEMALGVFGNGRASQREMQVIGGGLVYAAMVRRPLLSCLNQIWRYIVSCEGRPPNKRFWLSREIMAELFHFVPVAIRLRQL